VFLRELDVKGDDRGPRRLAARPWRLGLTLFESDGSSPVAEDDPLVGLVHRHRLAEHGES
jgi:hypothetical protein